ncbi:MAG: insulinase family protein [Acidobacteria bacterium]|nr:insulinase family protein [Acidobacteriota bacterium]
MVDSPSGRLYKALVDTKKAVGVLSGNFQQKEPGYAIYGVRLNKDQSVDEVEKILIQTVETFAATPTTKEEIDRFRTTIERQLDTVTNDANTVVQMMTEWVAKGDWRLYFDYRSRLKSVTPEDVQRVAKSYFLSSNRSIAKFIPTDNPVRASIKRYTDEEITAIAGKAKPPEKVAEGEVFETTIANIEARTKRGQIGSVKTAFLAKKTRGEVVTLRLTMNHGDEKSLRGLNQTAGFVDALLMTGTAKRNRQQIKDDLDRLKSSITTDGGASSAGMSITSTRQNLADTLKLAAEILKEPAFPPDEFEKAKTQRLSLLENQRTEPQAIALREMQRAFSRAKKGDFRYVPTLDEEIEAVKAVTLEEVKKFHKEFYGASNAQLSIVGDFDEKEITPVIDQLFGNWKSPKPYQRIPQEFYDASVVKKSFETPDKPNAVIFARQNIKMNDANPDYPALVLGNFIFGGGF